MEKYDTKIKEMLSKKGIDVPENYDLTDFINEVVEWALDEGFLDLPVTEANTNKIVGTEKTYLVYKINKFKGI